MAMLCPAARRWVPLLMLLLTSAGCQGASKTGRRQLQQLNPDIARADGLVLLEAAKAWGKSFPRVDTWNLSNPCSTWKGINCDPGNFGRVINIRLGDSVPRLEGSIPEVLSRLGFLRMMDLSYNLLTGVIPWKLAYLQRMAYLDLSMNQLAGGIPHLLGNAKNLVYLNLNGNQLTGSIPPQLANLKRMQKMDLQDNLLTGPLPPITQNWTRLLSFNVSNNFLTGAIPATLLPKGKYPYIGLSSNYFYGTPSADSETCKADNIEANDNCLLLTSATKACASYILSEQKTSTQCIKFCSMKYKKVSANTTIFTPPCQGCKAGAICTSTSSPSSPVVSFSCQGC